MTSQSPATQKSSLALYIALIDVALFFLIPYLDRVSPTTVSSLGAGLIVLMVSVLSSAILLIVLLIKGFAKNKRSYFIAAVVHLVLWALYLPILFNLKV